MSGGIFDDWAVCLPQVFGGGRSLADSAVAKVVAAGFAADVAQWALKGNGNDIGAAIRELRAVSGL